MKHLKKFESFSMNEELDVKNIFKNIKDNLQRKFGDFIIEQIKKYKNDPEISNLISKLAVEMRKLTDDDRNKLRNCLNQGNIPSLPKIEEDYHLEDGSLKESMIYEGNSELAGKIIKALGISTMSLSAITLIIAIIKMVIAKSGYPVWIFGLSLGTMAAILVAAIVVGGIVTSIGTYLKEKE